MKLTEVLLKQNIGWHFKEFWAAQKVRKIIDTGAKKILETKGIPVYNPDDILSAKKREFQKINIIGLKPKPATLDESHPNWHERSLLTYKDDNVLLEGLEQAKILTNTVELTPGHLPDRINGLLSKTSHEFDEKVKRSILSVHVFDAEQKKLPKIKDANRPAWNFPRTYGITQQRINKLLLGNILHLIESGVSDANLRRQRYLVNDLLFSYNFEQFDNLLQFQLTAESLLTSSKPLSAVTSDITDNFNLPDLYPILPTITLNEEHIYDIQHIYPIKSNILRSHPHTIFAHYNNEQVRNLYGEEVTEEQIYGRSLLKAFTVAASYANRIYGVEVADKSRLPQPVVVQCVQTDGRQFHFGVFQLNTLKMDGNGVKNVWYQTERFALFDSCSYEVGRPVLKGFNNKVIQYINAFYNNV